MLDWRFHGGATKPPIQHLNEIPILTSILPRPEEAVEIQRKQVARSLGPLGCTCYQVCTCGLSTRWSTWDLSGLLGDRGKRDLGSGFALRCFQRFSFLDVATQLWRRPAN